MSSSNENIVLSAIGTRTILNLICKLLFRFLHFFLNSLIIHHIDPNIIGIANVRLQLLYTTILFLSREAFRRTVPKLTHLRSIHHYINLTWLIIPAGLVIIIVSLPLTLFIQTNHAENYPFYYHACVFYALAAFIELLSEPLYLLASAKLNYHINIYIEMFASMIGFSIQAILIYYNRQYALYYYGFGYIIYSLLITLSYYFYFFICNKEKRYRLFAIKSFKDLIIKPTTPYVDHRLLNETITFFRQGIWMKLLTEGERYIMSLFNLVSYKDQGIFDIINNLGSLLPRLIFSTLEESAYAYFQQTLARTKTTNDEQSSAGIFFPYEKNKSYSIDLERRTIVLNALKFYNYLLRFVLVLSFLVIAFGIPYSRFILNLYGGSNLIDGPGVLLLQLYCIYILFLAVNGITEAFSQATMSIKELENYKNLISIFACIYLGIFYILIKFIGIYGIILANCLNMLLRIITNIFYIYRYFHGIEWSKPFEFSLIYLFSLSFCSFLCFYSEQWFSYSLIHFSFGAILGLCMLVLTWKEEREMIHYIYCILRLNREKKNL
jgi:oligosaccharide translocation protein RFT1